MNYPKHTPKIIWLQLGEQDPAEIADSEWDEYSDVSWCADKIDDTDVEYVRIDIAQSRDYDKAIKTELEEELNQCLDCCKRVGELESEVERLRLEIAKANNEFGSETADWPDLWKRIAELKHESGKNYHRGIKEGMEHAAVTAWRTGMEEDRKQRFQEAREVGAKCAAAIRKEIK